MTMMCCRLQQGWITRVVDDQRDRESWVHRTPSMTEAERKDAALPILVFGAPMVDRFYSKNYSDKEAGLLLLQEALKEYVPDAGSTRPERLSRAAVFLIQKGVRDKVFSVAQLACATLSLLLSHFFAKNRVSKKECGTALDQVLPDLLSKTADNAVRTQQLAVATITEMLTFSLTRGCGSIGAELSKPISHTVHPRSALCRANITEAQINRIGAAPLPKDRDTGFTARQLAEFGLSAVQHPGSDVRKAGERVLLTLYLRHPLAVRRVLPHEDEPARKNVLFRNLFEQLDLIDAKRATTPRGRTATVSGGVSEQREGGASGRWVPTTLALAACGGSSNSSSCASNCSVNSSSSGSAQQVPHISVTPDGGDARGKALCRINSSKDLREDEDEMQTLGQPSPLTPSPGSQASPLTPASLDMEEEKTCIFCGLSDDSLLGAGLDLHYWRSCPLLTRCSHCKQVVEIASLSQHLVDDCDECGDYRRCERCTEAVHRKEWRSHTSSLACTAAKPPALANHCPLCHENVQPWDEGWRAHLLPGPNSCPANPRSQPVSHKVDHHRVSDVHSRVTDNHGRVTDSHGRVTDSHGRVTDGHGRVTDSHGRVTDCHGRVTDGHGRVTDGHGRVADGHGRVTDGHGRVMDGHSRKVVDYSSDHRSSGDLYGRRLIDYGDHSEVQGRPTAEFERLIDDSGRLPVNSGRYHALESVARSGDLRRTASADQDGGTAPLHGDQGGDRRATEARGASGGAHTLPRPRASSGADGPESHLDDYGRPAGLGRSSVRTKIATPVSARKTYTRRN